MSVESIDDQEDMQFADEAFDILGFTKEEKYNVYKITAVVMHLGEFKFKQKSSKDEQAVSDETKNCATVAKLLGESVAFPYSITNVQNSVYGQKARGFLLGRGKKGRTMIN